VPSPNEVRPSREVLRASMDSWHARLLDAVGRAEAAGLLEEPGACGEWSARDVFGHVVFYERWITVQLGAPLDLPPPGPPEEMDDVDRQNAYFAGVLREASLGELLRDDAEAYAAVRERLAALTEAELDRPWQRHGNGARPAVAGDTAPARPLWQWVNGDTAGHYEEHASGLEAWLDRRAPAG
jgi:Mycothiol maleylpyruvate isomerase N-terminal domain